MLSLVFLVLGIVGFVKGKMSISSTKELRGTGMYIVATLFCLPLPLSFAAGFVYGMMLASSGGSPSDGTVMLLNLIFGWGPIIAGFILAFTMAQPKTDVPAAKGFDVMPPPPPRQ